MLRDPLVLAARHGQWVLVAGLVAGLALPGLAHVLRPWLPALVALLVFLSLLRLKPGALAMALRTLPQTAAIAAVLQLALPLGVWAGAQALGLGTHPASLALVLMCAAPSIMGSPNISMMLGAPPDYALRLMVVGTALLPLTVLPVFAIMPAVQGTAAVGQAAVRLVALIGLSALAAMAVQRVALRHGHPKTHQRLEGVSALALAVFVIGLMPQVSALALQDPATLVFWLMVAFGANMGGQILAWYLLRGRLPHAQAVPLALITGNRNIALFLVSLPAETTAPIMGFIGCYQLPMYLTPLLMARLYRARPT
ncbi:MAG: hypothetical protein ACO37E_14280 [Lutimaribacter sp.]